MCQQRLLSRRYVRGEDLSAETVPWRPKQPAESAGCVVCVQGMKERVSSCRRSSSWVGVLLCELHLVAWRFVHGL
jgi:hypothetical protein